MFNKLSRRFSSIFLCIFLTSMSFFGSIDITNASEMALDTTDENTMGIVIEKSTDNLDSSKTNIVPDLGDDQTFPFIPGFGKNSGKD